MGNQRWVSVCLLAVFITLIPFTNCSRAKFGEADSSSKTDSLNQVLSIIEDGDEINPERLPECDVVDSEFPTACLIFKDSFEREAIVDNEDFRWDTVLMDKSSNFRDVDVKIEDSSHLGSLDYGDKALLFRGREGGSTHEVYLVSAPFDVADYDKVVVQYRYVPIDLENRIKLSWNGWRVPEGPRVDVCTEDDYECGLTGERRYKRLRDPDNWNHHWPEFSPGETNQIRNYALDAWQMQQVVIDLADVPEQRRSKFVFKIAVALDEGYVCDDREKEMEDGVIVDQVVFAALRIRPKSDSRIDLAGD